MCVDGYKKLLNSNKFNITIFPRICICIQVFQIYFSKNTEVFTPGLEKGVFPLVNNLVILVLSVRTVVGSFLFFVSFKKDTFPPLDTLF